MQVPIDAFDTQLSLTQEFEYSKKDDYDFLQFTCMKAVAAFD